MSRPPAASTAVAPRDGDAAALRLSALLGSPRARAALVYGALALVALAVAYQIVFSSFATYDDEGTLLTTLKAFVDGDTLYDRIYTPYGPLYYEVWGSLFALSGRPVTSDSARFAVMVVWTGASLLLGLAAHRITGRLALGAGAFATAFATLAVLAREPMHPVGLVVVLLALMILAIVALPDRRELAAGAVVGVLLAGLLLTKVNVGVYAIAGCAFAAVNALPALRSRVWLHRATVAAYVLLPVVLMAGEFDVEERRDLAFFLAACAIALAISAWRPAARGGGEEGTGGLRLVVGAVGGFGAAIVVILGAIVANGTSLSALLHDVVEEALRQHAVFSNPLPISPGAIELACMAVGGAAVVAVMRDGRPVASPWPGIVRIVAGLAMWVCAAQIAVFGFNLLGTDVVVPAALAWIAVLAPPGTHESAGRRFARVAMPAIALAQVLQVYPVAGTQIGAAAVTFVPAGAICLADGLHALRAWAEEPRPGPTISTAVAVATAALAVFLVYSGMARPGFKAAGDRGDLAALPFAGAGRIRVDPEQRRVFARLVELIGVHGCTALVGLPSSNSLYLWTSIDPPSMTLPSAWMTQLDDELQQRAVDETRRSPRPCAIRNDVLLSGWMNGKPPPDTPLVRYIEQGFQPAETVTSTPTGAYSFMLPRPPRAKGSGG